MYIYQRKSWPRFTWNMEKLAQELTETSFLQGKMLGKMQSLGFDFRQETLLQALTSEITQSGEIEGEHLNNDEVRSSIARRLNINNDNPVSSSHHIDGVVEMMIDATHNYDRELTLDRLYRWHAALFPTGYSGLSKINVGCLRDDAAGAMRVVSGMGDRERVYYEAPPAGRLPEMMSGFLKWFNGAWDINPLIMAGIGHLWFITLHPFDDGNGRIARAITDMALSKAEKTPYRFYSMAAEIQKEKNDYYMILEKTQKGDTDITDWLLWFLKCLKNSILSADTTIEKVIEKARLWEELNKKNLTADQRKMLNMLTDGFNGHLTSSKWAKICKCSQDTANRAIKNLVEQNVLETVGAGRNTRYVLKRNEIC